VANFNPAAFAQDLQVPWSYLEPLVRPDQETMAPTPLLARAWSWHNDGRELRFALRDDVRWHDGTPFTAADAVFSFEVYRDDAESLVAGFFGLVDAIEAVGEHELTVTFYERDANWLFNAATLPIVSRQQYAAYWQEARDGAQTLSGFDWSAHLPLGTGPWRVDAWDQTAVSFARFEDYWGEGAWLDGLTVEVEPGINERLEAWSDGDSALLWPVTSRSAGKVEAGFVSAPAASVMFAAFNFANPLQPNGSLWTDIAVRRAASMALNRQRYAEEVFAGNLEYSVAGTVAQPWAHDASIVSPDFNPISASSMLAEAGWLDLDGDGVREDATGVQLRPNLIVQEGSRPELLRLLARVARDLAGVGIALTIEVLPAARFEERWIVSRDYDLIAYAYDLLPGFTDYDLYGSNWDIRANPAGWNPGGYSNSDADAAIDEFLHAVSLTRQRAALAKLQAAVNEDLFGLWFGFPRDAILVSDQITGFEPDIAWQTAQTWKLRRSEAQ
jgi:peptide/nickel transport system substrate-binding protein